MKNNSSERLFTLFGHSSGVTTDSRNASQGKIFIALKGDNFDGNDFAEKAVAQGALGAVVSSDSAIGRKVLAGHKDIEPERYIVVEDTLKELQDLARRHRQQFDIPVIALTGTNGKTTTKELVTAVLSSKYRVTATEGNLNNHIGVPLTLLRITSDTELAVIEMGASAPGEIKTLVDIALPSFGLITNVGKAHLEGFGSLEGVKKTKGELYDFLCYYRGTAFYNSDNEDICEMVRMRGGIQTIPYGVHRDHVEILPVTSSQPFLRMKSDEGMVTTHLIGSYNADNVLAALCVGRYFEVPFSAAASAIEDYSPSNHRSQLLKTSHNLLVMDTYNANPTSMRTSLDNFQQSLFDHKVLILGDMRELGKESLAEHREIVKMVQGMDVEQLFYVGDEFGSVVDSGYPSVEGLIEYFALHPIEGKTILIKGSHSVGLQKLTGIL